MGKGKLQRHVRHRNNHQHEQDEDPLPSSVFDLPPSVPTPLPDPIPGLVEPPNAYPWDGPNKHELYQLFVQSPKGDISYLRRFFLTYLGGRSPVHLREDFCGTALICAEWLKGGIGRFATGLDLDSEALLWGLNNNIEKLGLDACNRARLLHGNVLEPISMARRIKTSSNLPINDPRSGHLTKRLGREGSSDFSSLDSDKNDDSEDATGHLFKDPELSNIPLIGSWEADVLKTNDVTNERNELDVHDHTDAHSPWPSVDIVCALNYSCCCLKKRSELVLYFKYALESLNDNGGIFVMDVYGGVSSECPLKLRRHLEDLTYIWEQQAFDVITRTTKISLHFQVKNKRVLQHAFTYHWRLWSLPEIRDCLEEAGFDSIHIWVRKMPELQESGDNEDVEDDEWKYEEVKCFHQQSAWNAYIIAVAFKNSSC